MGSTLRVPGFSKAQEFASQVPKCCCCCYSGPTLGPLAKITPLIGSLAIKHDVSGRFSAGNRISRMVQMKALG